MLGPLPHLGPRQVVSPRRRVLGAGMGFGSPVRASKISQGAALEDDAGPKSPFFTSSAAPVTVLPPLPCPAPTAESVAIDYIDALWQSVSQVKTLRSTNHPSPSVAVGSPRLSKLRGEEAQSR